MAVNPSLLAYRPVIEGIGRPDGEVCIFTHLKGTDVLVDAELFGRVEGYELKGLRLGKGSILDRLGGFEVHATGMIGGIRVETDDASTLVHESTRIGDSIVNLELVSPPV